MPPPDLDLDTTRRDAIVRSLQTELEAAVQRSVFRLRGSLSTGECDEFSDIDCVWTIPDCDSLSLDTLRETLERVLPIDSLRIDPAGSTERERVVFVQFRGLPVFWRVDLVVEVEAADGCPPDWLVTEWSLPQSALANAVAAVKAVARGLEPTARELLDRGFARVGAQADPGSAIDAEVERLTRVVESLEPSIAPRAEVVRATAGRVLRG